MLRVHDIDYLDAVNTDGIALTIYFKGCRFNCKGCHNKDLQKFSGGTEYTVKELAESITEMYKDGNYDYVALLGGEPLQQNSYSLHVFLLRLYVAGVKVWLYTGYDYEDVPSWCKEYCYCIKTGLYKPDEFPPKRGNKLASSNQCFWFKDGRKVY